MPHATEMNNVPTLLMPACLYTHSSSVHLWDLRVHPCTMVFFGRHVKVCMDHDLSQANLLPSCSCFEKEYSKMFLTLKIILWCFPKKSTTMDNSVTSQLSEVCMKNFDLQLSHPSKHLGKMHPEEAPCCEGNIYGIFLRIQTHWTVLKKYLLYSFTK